MEQGVAPVVEGEVACFECLYDLRGQPFDGRCPECGAAVAVALREDRWDRADAGWRRRIRRGLVWAAGEYVVVLVVVAIALVTRNDQAWIGVAMYGTMGVCSLVGGWMMTAREPGGRSGGVRWQRGVVRGMGVWVALAYALIAVMVMFPSSFLYVIGWRFQQWLLVALALVNGVKQTIQLLAMARVIRRVPGRPLRRAAWVWAWAPMVGWWSVFGLWWINDMGSEARIVLAIAILGMFAATVIYEGVLWWALRTAKGRA